MAYFDLAGALGGLGPALGWQQQAMQGQWQLASTAVANTYVVSAMPVEPTPVRAKVPESAVEWLDRRVNEIRLPLAA